MSEVKFRPLRFIRMSDKDDPPYIYPHDCTILFDGDPTKICRETPMEKQNRVQHTPIYREPPTGKQNRVQPAPSQIVKQKKQPKEAWGTYGMYSLTLATNFFTDLNGKARVAGEARLAAGPMNSVDFGKLVFSYGPEFDAGLRISENFYELSLSGGYAIYLSKDINIPGNGFLSYHINNVGLGFSSGLAVRHIEYNYLNSNTKGVFCPYLSLGIYLATDQKWNLWHLGIGVRFEPVVEDMKRSTFSIGLNGSL